MPLMRKILYIHGMGGGSDSRIPSILQECLKDKVVARTYDFDPEVAAVQISSWVEELRPSLIIGESLGALHALRIKDVPLIFVSPALNSPFYFGILAWLCLIPGVTWIFDRIYKPRPGDRQNLHFTFKVLRKYRAHRNAAMRSDAHGRPIWAFFGTDDHYRKSGIVSVRTWKKHFGNTCTLYKGTHFMEEEFVRTLLVQKVESILNTNK